MGTKFIVSMLTFAAVTALAEEPVSITLRDTDTVTVTAPAAISSDAATSAEAAPAVTVGDEIKAPAKISTLSESEIPVFASKETKKILAKENMGYRVGLTLAILLSALGVGAFGVRKWMHRVRAKNPATQIKVLTQHYLGPKKSLAIIRVAGESILIGVTDQNISLIKSLALLDDDIPEATPEQFSVPAQSSQENYSPETFGQEDLEEFQMKALNRVGKSKLSNIGKWL